MNQRITGQVRALKGAVGGVFRAAASPSSAPGRDPLWPAPEAVPLLAAPVEAPTTPASANTSLPVRSILDDGRVQAMSFYYEKVDGAGEDAPPLVVAGTCAAFIGVWDGLGGAGAQLYEVDGETRTGAYLASRLARDVTERTLASAGVLDVPRLDGTQVESFVDRLTADLVAAFAARAAELGVGSTKIKGMLRRTLPTTFAGLIVRPDNRGAMAFSLSAGDSRAYALGATLGLRQLSLDDLKYPRDPLQALSDDSPISNLISLDPFKIKVKAYQTSREAMFLVATDGCFGYVPAPWHFEGMLLRALLAGRSRDEVQAAIRGLVVDRTADDATLAALLVLIPPGDKARKLFADRNRKVKRDFMAPVTLAHRHQVSRGRGVTSADEVRAATQRAWDAYRTSYEYGGTPGGRK